MYRRVLPLFCGAISLFDATPAMAQNPPAGAAPPGTQAQPARQALEEIVVTARKRTESLQDVPVAVSAISPIQLESNLATDLNKVAELAPQVMIGRATNGTGGFLTIRGISSSATDAGLDQSVAVVVDGVPLSRGRVINSAIYDSAQVEILQGPQSLFFGKNSPAGVISVRSKDPTDTFEGYVNAGYEFEADERYLQGAVSGPLTDTLNARLAVRASMMDGWIENVAGPVQDPRGVWVPGATFGETGPDGDNYAARLSLLWSPSEDFDANLKLTWDQQTMNAMDAYVELFCTGGKKVPTMLGAVLPGADCKKDQVKAESSLAPIYAVNWPGGNDGVPYYYSKFVLSSLELNKRFDDITLTSTTGYYDQIIAGGNTADFSPFALIWSTQHEDYELLTEELRATSDFSGPLNFMAGLYFETSSRTWWNLPDIFHAGFNTAAQNWTTVETWASADSDSIAAFAQVLWGITDTLELAAGARYTDDQKDGEFENVAIGVSGTAFYPAGQVLKSSYSDDNVSPEVTLTWQPSDGHTLYGAYKTGYKAGGISNGALLLASATPDNLKFGPEETDGFEVGYKALLFDGTLRLDLTAYSYDYDGLQVGSFNSSTFTFTIGNAAKASTEGVQASFDWMATDNLTFNGNLGYNKARYEDYENAPCYVGQTAATGCNVVGGVRRQDLSDEPLPRAPDLMFSLGADYRATFAGGWTADFSADAAYTDEYMTATDNTPGGIQEDFWRFNAGVHVMPENEKYRVSLIGRNLTNEFYLLNTVNHPGGTADQFVGVFNRPREVVLQAEYRF